MPKKFEKEFISYCESQNLEVNRNQIKVIKKLESVAKKVKASLADIIVLAGNVGLEKSIKKAGFKINVPFTPGRGDATQNQTDIDSFKVLEPLHDAFRNWLKEEYAVDPEEMCSERPFPNDWAETDLECSWCGFGTTSSMLHLPKPNGINKT